MRKVYESGGIMKTDGMWERQQIEGGQVTKGENKPFNNSPLQEQNTRLKKTKQVHKALCGSTRSWPVCVEASLQNRKTLAV